MELAGRMERLGTETAFSVLAKAKALEAQGREIIHLEIGEPDFDTPAHIVEAGCRALRDGQTHYTPTAGIPELREAIADDVARSRGIAGRIRSRSSSRRAGSRSCSSPSSRWSRRATRCCCPTPRSRSTSRW